MIGLSGRGALARGEWVSADRIARIALLMLLATIAMIGYLFATATGSVDAFGRPLGTDFSNVWTAGRMALEGRAALAWDWQAHFAMQQAAHHRPDIPFYGWHYPPPFLLVAALLAMLPYVPALIVWQGTTLAMALATVRRILPGRGTALAAIGAPVVLVNLGHGHNGFLTAALLGGGLLLLDRRPVMAGLLLGCVVYKPQFGLVLPILLLVGGHWRAIGGALLSAGFVCALTWAIWGPSVWIAFLDSLPLTQSIVLEQGSTGWEKIQSAFSATRNWGGSVDLAWTVQAVSTAAAVGGTIWIARRARPSVRDAGVIAAALLSTPYLLDYDLAPLGIAIAFLVAEGRERGFRPYEKTCLAIVWIAPLVARGVMQATTIPIGLVSIGLIFLLALRRTGVCAIEGRRDPGAIPTTI